MPPLQQFGTPRGTPRDGTPRGTPRELTNVDDQKATHVCWYMVLLCVSTASRSFEAGILSAMMPDVKESLEFSFSLQGTIAAAPDFGLVPGALIAIGLFSCFRAHTVVSAAIVGISISMLTCACYPSTMMLIMVRAFNGLFWSFCAVHYPTWIDRHGPEDKRTVWLGCYNAFLVLGAFGGIFVGSLARLNGTLPWTLFFAIDGVVMLACGIAHYLYFSDDLVQVVALCSDPGSRDSTTRLQVPESKPQTDGVHGDPPLVPAELMALCGSSIFLFVLGVASILAGMTAFILYFITQSLLDIGFTPLGGAVSTLVIMALAPVPGILIGAKIAAWNGGYQNHVGSFALFVGSSVISTISLALLALFVKVGSKTLFLMVFYVLLFAGALPASALNGIAVSVVPGAAHYASGMLIFSQNLTKAIAPLCGGLIIDRIGLLPGVFTVMCVMMALCVFFSTMGLRVANCEAEEKLERIKGV